MSNHKTNFTNMNKKKIDVPDDLDYISNWKTYTLPKGHCIVDKGVTGCGYTEYCISNSNDLILCSPRKLLLENKFDQHQGEDNIFYLRNELEIYNDLNELKEQFRIHILNCEFKHKPVKVLVTYDSTHIIVDFLKEFDLLNKFYFIVDEFQSIFLDSYFKSEVENDFVEYLQDCPNVLYLSATPMLDKYLEKLDMFKDLIFYQLDWKNSKYTETINIQRKKTNSLGHECKKIIEDYLSRKYPYTTDDNGQLIQSKEAVFYFNSISDIIRTVKSMGLTSANTTIICSDTSENREKLGKIGFSVSKVPLKGEINKMFTFCTRSVYIGADFYSDCASSYIFADPNIKSLALDISLDLPQIVGRQRNRSNPFKNKLVIFYKTIRGENIENILEFNEKQQQRKDTTIRLLNAFASHDKLTQKDLLKKFKDSIEVSNYSDDFISVSKKTGEPVYNHFIEIANERAWEVSQVDYQDKITVTKSINKQGYKSLVYHDEDDLIVSDFLKEFYLVGVFEKKMKMYCEFMDVYKINPYVLTSIIHKVDPKFKTYYDLYGTSGCKSVGYIESLLKTKISNSLKSPDLKERLISYFKVGSRYELKTIKLTLKSIYLDLGITKTPKASELENYFDVSGVKIYDSVLKKQNKGYLILGIK